MDYRLRLRMNGACIDVTLRVMDFTEAGSTHCRTRGSAVLWRVYLEFEIRCGELKRAKTLLFRAVGACPLVKGARRDIHMFCELRFTKCDTGMVTELYLLAFGPLRSVFSGRELQDWGEAMVERGIRLRRGLNEALEGWVEVDGEAEGDSTRQQGGGGGGGGGEAGEDEIEYNARELRRLRPY